jgi:hypothetical protein
MLFLAAMKKDHGRYGGNSILRGQIRFFFSIDFNDLYPAVPFLRQTVEYGAHHFARPAPLGPKIDQYRFVASGDEFIETKWSGIHNDFSFLYVSLQGLASLKNL